MCCRIRYNAYVIEEKKKILNRKTDFKRNPAFPVGAVVSGFPQESDKSSCFINDLVKG